MNKRFLLSFIKRWLISCVIVEIIYLIGMLTGWTGLRVVGSMNINEIAIEFSKHPFANILSCLIIGFLYTIMLWRPKRERKD